MSIYAYMSSMTSTSLVSQAVLRALELLPVDLRASLIQNLVLVGGMATLRGMLPRLAQELKAALQAHPALQALAPRLRVTPLDFAPVAATWTGAAVFGALEGLPEFTAEDFQKGKALPDWLESGFV